MVRHYTRTIVYGRVTRSFADALSCYFCEQETSVTRRIPGSFSGPVEDAPIVKRMNEDMGVGNPPCHVDLGLELSSDSEIKMGFGL
jgi:hypothetical protein